MRCEWSYDKVDGNWAMSCSEHVLGSFEFGGPIESGYRYCPRCGKRLMIVGNDEK